ncbi:MAG: SurA N-terminal domain-containing protein [Paracoccus sp. (in: a-proteobacteria)]
MTSLRTKGKSTIVWILMGLLLLGLGGFGVTSFSSGTSEIGSVGKTSIDAATYRRVLVAQMDDLSRQAGRRITLDEARALGLPQSVQAQLYVVAVLAEEARLYGVSVGDETVAKVITAMPAFQGPGGFDRVAYGDTLRREGLTEEKFESDVRADQSRLILQDAVVSGVSAPAPQVALSTGWALEKRDISWVELTVADLPAPVRPADQATLEAWHQANADRFTAPEMRKISYVWINPEILADKVDLDETALRDLYDSKAGEYHQPERRLVSQLVFESPQAAQAAKERIDAGESFETIAGERGLALADTELGEMSEAELGQAGPTVFAAADNGVIGPVETELGPALISVNAILDPIDVSFEEALPDLRAEAAADRARRLIADMAPQVEDLLAGGATLQQVADQTDLEIGQIEWTADVEAAPGEIGGYPAFRERAVSVSEKDYPELFDLDDGGIFALQLDAVVPPTLIPFADVKEKVAADWAGAEGHRQLLSLAERLKLRAVSETIPPVQTEGMAPAAGPAPAPGASPDLIADPALAAAAADAAQELPILQWHDETGVTRDGWLEAAPPALIEEAFKLSDGETEMFDDGQRVALVRVNRVGPADLSGETAQEVSARIEERLDASLQGDVFDYFIRAVEQQNGIAVNSAAIAAIEAQM